MFVQHCFHLLEALRVLLLKDLVSEAADSMWPGMFHALAERGHTVSVSSTRDATSDTVASYAISDGVGARKNALDNRRRTAVNKRVWLLNDHRSTRHLSSRFSPFGSGAGDMSARKILVVDDNDNVRSFLVLLLERSGGYETLEAATGEEAVEKAISGRPDIILMDIILPGINGVDAAKAIRNNPSTAQIPIIAYSALPLVGWKEQALKAGMVAYLQKPINLQLLMETIQKFIPS